MPLLLAIAHGRQHCTQVRILPESLRDLTYRKAPRIDQLGTELLRRDRGSAVAHLAVSDRWTILDRNHAATAESLRVVYRDGRFRLQHLRTRIQRANRFVHALDIAGPRRVDLVDDDDIRQ